MGIALDWSHIPYMNFHDGKSGCIGNTVDLSEGIPGKRLAKQARVIHGRDTNRTSTTKCNVNSISIAMLLSASR